MERGRRVVWAGEESLAEMAGAGLGNLTILAQSLKDFTKTRKGKSYPKVSSYASSRSVSLGRTSTRTPGKSSCWGLRPASQKL